MKDITGIKITPPGSVSVLNSDHTPGFSFAQKAHKMNKMQARVIVFVDGSNFYHGMKKVDISPSDLDYAKMSQKLSIGQNLIETRFYIGKIKQTRGSENLYKNQRKFLSRLERQDNVTTYLGRVEKKGGQTWVEKAVDVMIAVDMVSMAYEDKYDVAYLLSADGDFTPAVKKVRESGREVFVASPILGRQITQAANAFTLLDKEFFDGCWT